MDITLLILSIRRYDFEDQKTGKKISGVKVKYIDFSKQKEDENLKGYIISEETLDFHRFNEFYAGAGFYSVNLGFDLTAPKPKVIFDSTNIISPLDLSDLYSKIA